MVPGLISIFFKDGIMGPFKTFKEQGIVLTEKQLRVSVKVKHCCAKKSLRQSFQLKKSRHNQCNLDKSFKYNMDLVQNNIYNKCIQVGKLNCYFVKLFFTDFQTGI